MSVAKTPRMRDLGSGLLTPSHGLAGPRCWCRTRGLPPKPAASRGLLAARNADCDARDGGRDPRPCEHMFVTSQGSAYARFQRAIVSGKGTLIRNAARELPRVDLTDALAVCVVIRSAEPERFERATLRLARALLKCRRSNRPEPEPGPHLRSGAGSPSVNDAWKEIFKAESRKPDETALKDAFGAYQGHAAGSCLA